MIGLRLFAIGRVNVVFTDQSGENVSHVTFPALTIVCVFSSASDWFKVLFCGRVIGSAITSIFGLEVGIRRQLYSLVLIKGC